MTKVRVKVNHISTLDHHVLMYFGVISVVMFIVFVCLGTDWKAVINKVTTPSSNSRFTSTAFGACMNKKLKLLVVSTAFSMSFVMALLFAQAVNSTIRDWNVYSNPVIGQNDEYISNRADVNAAIIKDFKVTPIKQGVKNGFLKNGVVYGDCSPVFSKAVNGRAAIDHVECIGGKAGGVSASITR